MRTTIPIIYSDKHAAHNPPHEIYDGKFEPYAEKPDRLAAIVTELTAQGVDSFQQPKHFSREYITKVHKEPYVHFLQKRSHQLREDEVLYPSYFMMDTYTPIVSKTYDAALTAVDVALTGAELLLQKEPVVYALCRPPGHHAEAITTGGYCYFNNAAIAANYLSEKGKVAILDIDFHHGNGTQHMFYDRSDVFYVSLHADPTENFPYISGFADEVGRGQGVGYTLNVPLPRETDDAAYSHVLEKALAQIATYQPDFFVVSCGFDTYKKDPIGGLQLLIPYYQKMAESVMSLHLPTLVVQEGGYHIEDLGKIAYSFLQGLKV